VATRVIAHYAELLLEHGYLRIPHREIRAEGIGENEHGCVGRTNELIVDASIFELSEGHRTHFFRIFPFALHTRRKHAVD